MSLSFAEEEDATFEVADSKHPTSPSGARESSHRAPRHHPLAAVLGVAGAVMVMLLSLVAFVGGSGSASVSGTAVGQVAPDFSLRDGDQRRVTLEEFRGRPVLLLVTDRALPDVSVALGGLDQAISIVRVFQGIETADQAPHAPTAGAVDLMDQAGIVAGQYGIRELPAALLISAEGVILDRGPLLETLGRLHLHAVDDFGASSRAVARH